MGLFNDLEDLIGRRKRANRKLNDQQTASVLFCNICKPHTAIKGRVVLHYMYLASLVILVSLTHSALAQQQAESHMPRLKCPYSNAGCNSFQELYQHRDPELLDDLNKDHDYVCFLPTKEDRFFVVWFTGPEEDGWRATGDRLIHSFKQNGSAMVVVYKNGIFDDEAAGPLWTRGEWECPSSSLDSCTATSQSVTFTGNRKVPAGTHEGAITIDNSTFTLSNSFINKNSSETQYSFVLQRSTGRFTERYSAEHLQEENYGRCIAYRR